MATDHNFKVKNGLTVQGETLVVNHTGDLSGTQVYIKKKDSSTNLQRWGEGTVSNADSYRFRIDQDFKFIGNTGSGDNIILDSNTGNIRGTTFNVGSTQIIDSSRNLTNINSMRVTGTSGIGIGTSPSGFGTGVSTILLQGTSSTNGRAGAIWFKEYDGSNTTVLYSTDGADGYGTVLAAYQGDLKLATGSLTGTALTIDSSQNSTFAGTISSGAITSTGNITGAALIIDGNTAVDKSGTNYMVFYDGGGGPALYAGNTSDNRNYYQSTHHRFRSDDGNTNFAELSSAGLRIGGTSTPAEKLHVESGNIRVDGAYLVSGTTVIDSNRQIFAKSGTQVGEDGTYGGYGVVGFGGITNGYNRIFGRDDTNDGLFIAAATGRKVFIRSNGLGSDALVLGEDGTYGGYSGVGFGSNITNGYNRVFASKSQADGLFLASATGRSIHFRTNGGTGNTFTMSSGGDFQIGSANTTVIDASRNLTNIGTISNTGKHSSSIGSNATYSKPLLEITTSATPTQIKITTNILYSGTGASTHAHSVTIRGFQYGSAQMADLQIGWHVYLNSFHNRSVTSSGSWAPTVTLAVENNKVVIHLASPGYWPKLYVESMYNAYGGAGQASGWSWSDAAISADANTPNQTVPYKFDYGNGVLNSGGTTVIDGSRNLSNIGTGAFSGKLTINNANYANHLELVRGSDTLYLTPSGGQLLTNGGLSADVTNQDDLGRTDKYWANLWLGTSLKMGGTTVIDSSRNLTNIGSISSTGTLDVVNSSADSLIRIAHGAGNTLDALLQFSGSANDITAEGAELWYDNSVGDLHVSTMYNHVDAAIRFHTRTAGSKPTTNERFTITGDGNLQVADGKTLTLFNSSATSGGSVHLPRAGGITFYGNSDYHHAIMSRTNTGVAEDDIRINSYADVVINLDSNNNNDTNADLIIGRHGGGTGTVDTLATISGVDGTIMTEGFGNFQRDLKSAGQVRATGWWNDAASTDYNGLAFEIGISGSTAFALSYNRNTSSYGPMQFNANDFTFNNNIKMTGGYSLYMGTTSRFSSDNNGGFGINYGTTGGTATASLSIYNGTTATTQLFRDGTIDSADIHIESGTGGTNTQGLLFTLTDNADAQAYIKKTAYYMHYNAHYNEGHRFTVNGTDDLLRMHGSNNGTRPDSIDILAGNGLYMSNTRIMDISRNLQNIAGLHITGGGTYSDPGSQMYLHADGSGYGRLAVYDMRFMTGNNSARTVQALHLGSTGAATFASTISSGPITVTSAGASMNGLVLGSNTQSQYSNIILYSNSGNGQIWKNGGSGTSWGGTSSLNIYNSNGTITLHPQGNDTVVKVDSSGLHLANTADYISLPADSNQNKLRLYGTDSQYGIGMASGQTYGGLNDWAMTFVFSNESDRGFRWMDAAHGVSQGAMALTTDGRLTVAHSMRVGYGEGDTTTPGAAYDLDVSGHGQTAGRFYAIGGLLKTNRRISTAQNVPIGHYSEGDQVFALDTAWTDSELQAYFNSTNVSWSAQPDAPGGYAVYINGNVNVGGVYNSGFPYIPIDQDDEFYMECWIKNAGTGQTHYMGSNEFNQSFSSLGGNPGSYGYWVMSNTNPGSSWTKVSAYIGGFHANNVGDFEIGTKYWTPQALFNYGAGTGTRACYISGWKVIRVKHQGNRTFAGNVTLGVGGSTGVLRLRTYDDASNRWDLYTWTDDTFRVNYNGSGGDEMVMDSSGNVVFAGNVTAYSDEKLKENIKTLDGSKVLEMRGVSFTKDGQAGSGVIAQELEKVAPELVSEVGDFKSVSYGNLTGYLIEAVKLQQQKIEKLEELVEKLISEK